MCRLVCTCRQFSFDSHFLSDLVCILLSLACQPFMSSCNILFRDETAQSATWRVRLRITMKSSVIPQQVIRVVHLTYVPYIYLYTKVHSVTPPPSPPQHTHQEKQIVKVCECDWLIKSLSANTLSPQIPCTRTSVQAVCEVFWMTGTQSWYDRVVYFIGCCFSLSLNMFWNIKVAPSLCSVYKVHAGRNRKYSLKIKANLRPRKKVRDINKFANFRMEEGCQCPLLEPPSKYRCCWSHSVNTGVSGATQ